MNISQNMHATETGVIPENFVFGLRKQDEIKFVRNPIWLLLLKNQMGFRIQSHFPQPCGFGKSNCSGMTFFLLALFFALPSSHAAISLSTPAICHSINYTPDPSVDYKPGVDVHGHYVAPADINSVNMLPKKIEIPLTISLAKAINLDTTTAPFNQLGSGTEAVIGMLSVENNKVSYNGKPLTNDQQSNLSELCKSKDKP